MGRSLVAHRVRPDNQKTIRFQHGLRRAGKVQDGGAVGFLIDNAYLQDDLMRRHTPLIILNVTRFDDLGAVMMNLANKAAH